MKEFYRSLFCNGIYLFGVVPYSLFCSELKDYLKDTVIIFHIVFLIVMYISYLIQLIMSIIYIFKPFKIMYLHISEIVSVLTCLFVISNADLNEIPILINKSIQYTIVFIALNNILLKIFYKKIW